MKKVLTTRLVMMILTLMAALMIGCGEEEVPESSATDMLGTMKMPDAVAAAPQAPNVGFRIKEVGYYADWQLTKPLSGAVKSGTTVFTKVVFSEPVQFKSADDDSARPILYYRIDKKRFRYRIVKHGAGGEDFISGDAKPWGGGTDDYICKFIIPEDATDRFRIEIGKFNANKDGEFLPAFYTHNEQLQIDLPAEPEVPVEDPADTTPPTITAVAYYRDWQLTEVLTEEDTVRPGDTLYAKIVFSEPVAHVVSDDDAARPALSFVIDEQATRFQMAAHGAGGKEFLAGVCKPLHGGTDDYICKITIPTKATTLALRIEPQTADIAGNAVAATATHTAPFSIAVPVVTPLTIVSITHYQNNSTEPIPEGVPVDRGATIITEIMFSVPVRANSVVISYPFDSRTRYLSQSTGVHWRGTYQISADGTTVRSKLNASEEVFSLVVEEAISLDGAALQQSVAAPEVPTVSRVRPIVPAPPEPAVSEPQKPTAVEPASVVNGEFTDAAIEEYRALHAMVREVREMLANTMDPGVRARPHLVWDFVAGVEITAHESVKLDVIYRNQHPGITEDQGTKMKTAIQMEYLKIKLAHPGSTVEETLAIYTASVENGIVNKIRADLLDEEWGSYFIK